MADARRFTLVDGAGETVGFVVLTGSGALAGKVEDPYTARRLRETGSTLTFALRAPEEAE